ncbi:hypothetical protein HV213_15900 [Klebsiella sp. RHBSTW-00484]|uniref:hypothetical protein n=1 Tax=unclassified Klebsiella TaxID=2608929 RepID=UPI0015E54044|nr:MULTISPECIES: hypothetical protein [unclassified Klebsiella]MBA7846888.1 hypothetical protein [Klebsiella sp. RHBSTW-00465]QLO37199.1 hypothetical protein HV213_15900 [Klebsiella sp. RHBSTW-00484]QLT76717.1 hypothetical protein HV204_15900 [Klebsiella sp. RHBSTW-00464]
MSIEIDDIYQMVSVQDYMTDAEKVSADNPSGTVDHSAAFKQAFDSGYRLIFVPPVKGRYIVGDVVIPFGVKMIGKIGWRPYNVTSDASFNNVGSVIRKKNGSTNMFFWNTSCFAEEIVFDGVDRSTPAIESQSGGKITVGFFKCGFYRWAKVGNKTGAYLGCSFQLCGFNQNTIGIYNTVDGNHIGCVINANKSDGVRLETGADSNTFLNCRCEWNEGNNWSFFGCTSIQVLNEICDRAYSYGFRISNANVTLSNVDIRRSGKTATGNNSAHFYIESSTVKMIGVKTSSGVDDTGGNMVDASPAYTIQWVGAANSSTFDALGCNFSGFTAGVQNTTSSQAATRRVIDCKSLDDFVNEGNALISGGRRYIQHVQSQGVAGNIPVRLSFSTRRVNTDSNDINTINLLWRHTSTGTSNGATVTVVTSRGTGPATMNVIGIQCKGDIIGEDDVNSTTLPPPVGRNYQLTVGNVATDGSTFDLIFKAKATNTGNFVVRGYLQ